MSQPFTPVSEANYNLGIMPEVPARVLLSLMYTPGDPVVNATLTSFLGSASRMIAAVLADNNGNWEIDPAQYGVRKPTFAEFHTVCQSILDSGISVTVPSDPIWPHLSLDALRLEQPYLLYTRGNAKLLDWQARIGIIGSRSSTGYGEHLAMQFADEFSYKGYLTVTTGSFGIAGAATRAALACGRIGSRKGAMIVLPSGLAPMVPTNNGELFHDAIESEHSLVVSEMPPGTTPTRALSIRRHKLLAALSNTVVVLESGRLSGSTETLLAAKQLGRVGFAVPGPVTSVTSAGNHQAIKDGLALIATTPQEIVEAAAAFLTEHGA